MKTDTIADRFERMAETLDREIEHRRRPMTQNPTPKRLREYRSRLFDADNLERAQRAMRALARAHRAGRVPTELASLRLKAEILLLVRHSLEHRGYYDVIDSGQYADTSPAARALQAMIDAGKSDGDRTAEAARQQAQEIERLIDALRFQDIPGFFPTPDAVIERMIVLADLQPGQCVLEPSAGIGSIADKLREWSRNLPSGQAGITVLCCEIRPALREILRRKGHALAEAHDFLEMPVDDVKFDRILMNPPFEHGQDMDHVRRAFDHLAPGGRLVAIVSEGAFFRNGPKAQAFRAWLDRSGADVEPLPEGAFAGSDAFRRTGIRARLVVLAKPAEPETLPRGRATRQAGSRDPVPHSARRPSDSPAEIGAEVPSAAAPAPAESGTVPPDRGATEHAGSLPDRAPRQSGETSPESAVPTLPATPATLPARPAGNLSARYRPRTIGEVVGQPHVVRALASFVANPFSTAFVFHGPSGVGKTAAAWALAADLGADPDWGGVIEIPSGTQDGRAVEELLRSLRLRPLGGSGWRVAIVNEADRMTDQAEAIWLDALERLPSKVVVIFTTNNLHRMSQRFIRRCEVYSFDGSGPAFREALENLVRQVWREETGRDVDRIPEGLGLFETGSGTWSIGLALQQIAPYVRGGQELPDRIAVPFVRRDERVGSRVRHRKSV